MENQVLTHFRDENFNMSTFVRSLVKSKPEKIWKPDKFKFFAKGKD